MWKVRKLFLLCDNKLRTVEKDRKSGMSF